MSLQMKSTNNAVCGEGNEFKTDGSFHYEPLWVTLTDRLNTSSFLQKLLTGDSFWASSILWRRKESCCTKTSRHQVWEFTLTSQKPSSPPRSQHSPDHLLIRFWCVLWVLVNSDWQQMPPQRLTPLVQAIIFSDAPHRNKWQVPLMCIHQPACYQIWNHLGVQLQLHQKLVCDGKL